MEDAAGEKFSSCSAGFLSDLATHWFILTGCVIVRPGEGVNDTRGV